MLTEAKVLSFLRRALRKQNRKPERDLIALVKRDNSFVYKAYGAKARSTLTDDMKMPVPVYQAVLDNEPERFPGFESLLRRKRREYDNQSQSFADMPEDPAIAAWLKEFTLWDAENEEYIYLNDIQCQDINRMLHLGGVLRYLYPQQLGCGIAKLRSSLCICGGTGRFGAD